jgi:hypothetical protein
VEPNAWRAAVRRGLPRPSSSQPDGGVLLLVFAAYLLASGLHELEEAGILPESEALLAAAFLGLAGPTLYAFFRTPKRAAA